MTLESDAKFGRITGIWQIFTRAIASLKIRTLMGFFCPKLNIFELKIYRVMRNICHENEE